MGKKFFWSVFLLIVAFFGGGFLGFLSQSFAAGETELVLRESCGQETCLDFPLHNNELFKFPRNVNVGDRIPLQVIIKNPSQNPIYSVASWIKYNPAIFAIENLSAEKSAFPLAAPNEFESDSKTGELKIGRATTGGSVNTPEIFVASFDVIIKQNPKNVTLSFMDFQASGSGKTAVLTLDNFVPRNVLIQAPKNLIFISSSSGNVSANQNTVNNSTVIPTTQNGLYQNLNGTGVSQTGNGQPSVLFASQNTGVAIPRPDGFRARTYNDGRTEFLWKIGEDVRINGYYLYYSLTSGRYMHRRDVGKTNNFALPADFFEKGKRVFFAIQAYDATGKTSDFSDEAYVIVGTSGSESHPFFEQIFPNGIPSSVSKTAKGGNGNGLSANISGNSGIVKTNGNTPQSGLPENFFFLFFGSALILYASRKLS